MDTFTHVLSITATSSTFLLFLCGLQICRRIRDNSGTEGTTIAPFLLTAISCTVWLGYGIIRQDTTVIFVNAVGLLFQSAYLTYYYIKTHVKRKVNRFIALFVIVCIITAMYVNSDRSPVEKENLLGIICMLLNVATIGSPLADIGTVIRTKNSESLPFFLCVMNMGSSVQWLLYGILVDDFYMKVPNSVAVLISALQLSLFIIYPARSVKYEQLNHAKHLNDI